MCYIRTVIGKRAVEWNGSQEDLITAGTWRKGRSFIERIPGRSIQKYSRNIL